MGWWGKLVGGAFGFALGGPLGALLGAALGHGFDRGLQDTAAPALEPGDRERVQTAFFAATFAVMGRIAKADGRVSADEIQIAGALMDRMGLDAEHRRVAQALFREGKKPGFPLDDALDQLRRECRGRRDLLRLFLALEVDAALADGEVQPAERAVLRRIGERLGFGRLEAEAVEAMVRAERHFREQIGTPGRRPEAGLALADAYALLGVDPTADDAEVTRAYRRLMSQNHPDKLVSKGLPEEMIRLATEKTQEIKAAYERVRQARGHA